MPHEEVFEMSVTKLETETSLLLERELAEEADSNCDKEITQDTNPPPLTSSSSSNSSSAKGIFVKKVQSSAEMR